MKTIGLAMFQTQNLHIGRTTLMYRVDQFRIHLRVIDGILYYTSCTLKHCVSTVYPGTCYNSKRL